MHAHESVGGIPQQNMPQRHRTWQTEADVGIRRMIVEKILLLFQKKKPRVSPEWQQRLPDFVKRLEESLYRDALSKEEYADFSTLEQRLQAVAKQIGPIRSNPNVAAQGVNAPSSSMMPTPGTTSSVSGGSTMIPTPGQDVAKIPNPGTGAMNVNGASGVAISNPNPNVGNMVPTPGLGPEVLHSQSQSLSSGSSVQMYQDMNRKSLPGGGYVNSGHGSGQQLVNKGQLQMPKSNSNVGYSSIYMKSGNALQLPPMRRDGFSTELVGPGAFYNGNGAVSCSTLGLPLSGSQPSRMIPVPGLQPQHSRSQTEVKTPGSTKNQLLNTKTLHAQVSLEPNDGKSMGLGLQDNGMQAPGKLGSASASLRRTSPDDGQRLHPLQQSQKTTLQLQRNLSNEQTTQSLASSPQLLRHQGKQSEDEQQPQNLSDQQGGHRPEQLMKTVSKLDDTEMPQGSTEVAEQNPTSISSASMSNADDQGAQQYLKQQRWLLFLRHANKCSAPEGQCQTTPHCHTAKQLWAHIIKCTVKDCQYPRCKASLILIRHHQSCKDTRCPVCVSVRQEIAMKQSGQNRSLLTISSGSSDGSVNGHIQTTKNETCSIGPMEPPAKRVKIETSEQSLSNSTLVVPPQSAVTPEKNVGELISNSVEETNSGVRKCDSNSMCTDDAGTERICKLDSSDILPSKASMQIKQEMKEKAIASSSSAGDHANNVKGNKSKNRGVSLIELFTPEQIKEHIKGLRQWVSQSKTKPEKNEAIEHRINENSCQLCAVETLTFDPPPIYCTPCGARIKRNAFYWTMQCGETRHYFCVPCYNDARSDNLEVEGQTYPKTKLEKRRNDEEIDEPWVQCDKCEKWQHQICALFNMRRNEGGEAEYTCPQCLLEEMHKAERKPLPQSSVLGAKDLPKTLLSDHIEQRLANSLKKERQERAQAQGKSYDEVPGAESLVVRVVSSVEKKLEVKPRFLETFQDEGYPKEFPYKSKVFLLFQKIEGVEVCLFGMYVQEFGAESAQPNQRRVYLSYLDSVKYFRPDVRTVNGEALRTFVYHEILIAYLDYCKARGFTSCYIWACPPLKGEDYILYCHPEIQKTPKSDKLREWYLTMLSKATSEGIVVKVTNMYDYFFVCTGETKAKVTAVHLPYFDGDYWPGAAEDMIMQLQEEENGRKQQKKGKAKNAAKRSTKAATQTELASNVSRDLQLMQKLGESIYPMKEDFIMVHMQHACSHCCSFILSGRRWSCKQCKDFNICDGCYSLEQKRDKWDMHPSNSKEVHPLFPIETESFPDTKDKDEIMESEFFDTRQAFLSLCQGNHYQYDTLRRAKNSSMMVLYHLHNPTAPAYVTTCNVCHHDIETGQGWRCETCPDFDICNSCHSNEDTVKHPHKLVAHPSAAERDAQSKEARQQRVLQLRKMLYLLVHASQCASSQCQYPNCRRVKGLFRHGLTCRTRASGGCHLCMKMWYLLQLHARACKEAECRVPRCKDLKEHQRRAQQQMESRRRAAVMEMMRQRVAAASAGKS